jgi:drug/metabolite transporter (DMT)-like permease
MTSLRVAGRGGTREGASTAGAAWCSLPAAGSHGAGAREGEIRVFMLTALAMLAFAANSVLNRLALAEGAIGPAGFAAMRVAAGALVLTGLLALRDRGRLRPGRVDVPAVVALTVYMLGFSFAYVAMDAGLGALILFGGVQATMFAGALAEGARPPMRRWAGMILALGGLALLGWPREGGAVPPVAAALMACAALGWGIYSLVGRRASDPLAATGRNFVWCLPPAAAAALLIPDATPASARGLALAALSGGVTSALGYALWYALLPVLGATRGALAQLSVPAIALVLGALLLGEAVTATALGAAAMILGGVAVGLIPLGRRAGPEA